MNTVADLLEVFRAVLPLAVRIAIALLVVSLLLLLGYSLIRAAVRDGILMTRQEPIQKNKENDDDFHHWNDDLDDSSH